MTDIYLPFFPNEPAFQTRREVYSGDFVRGPEGKIAYQRYGAGEPTEIGQSLFVSRPVDYDSIQVWWGSPADAFDGASIPWNIMAVVRSGFGYPITPSDGEVILGLEEYRYADEVPGTIIDKDLPQGRWFYYSLMYRLGSRWYVGAKTQNIIPVNYKHGESMYEWVPPYHQSVDQQYTGAGQSALQRFCDVVGYDLDLTRTLSECLERAYDADQSPSQFLSLLGSTNLGYEVDEGVGTIRYRSLLAANRTLADKRGTSDGLASYIEAISKYETIAGAGLNKLLLVDDSEFVKGTGNWAPLPYGASRPYVALAVANSYTGLNEANQVDNGNGRGLYTRDISFEHGDPDDEGYPDHPDPNLPTRGMMKVTVPSDHDFAITCGIGQKVQVTGNDPVKAEPINEFVHFNPEWRGIPVDEDNIYYFTFWMYRPLGETESITTEFGLMYFDRYPSPDGYEANVDTGSTISTLITDDLYPKDKDNYEGRLLTITDAEPMSADPPGPLNVSRLVSTVTGTAPNLTFNIAPDWPIRRDRLTATLVDDFYEEDTMDNTEILPLSGDKFLIKTVDRRGFSDAFWGTHSTGAGFATYGEMEPTGLVWSDFVRSVGVDTGWKRYTMSSRAPTGARFAVPMVWVHDNVGGRLIESTERFFTAMMVSQSQGVGIETVYQPNSFIRLRTSDGPPVTNYPDDVLDTTTKVIGGD